MSFFAQDNFSSPLVKPPLEGREFGGLKWMRHPNYPITPCYLEDGKVVSSHANHPFTSSEVEAPNPLGADYESKAVMVFNTNAQGPTGLLGRAAKAGDDSFYVFAYEPAGMKFVVRRRARNQWNKMNTVEIASLALPTQSQLMQGDCLELTFRVWGSMLTCTAKKFGSPDKWLSPTGEWVAYSSNVFTLPDTVLPSGYPGLYLSNCYPGAGVSVDHFSVAQVV
jgi:hypothetical protein